MLRETKLRLVFLESIDGSGKRLRGKVDDVMAPLASMASMTFISRVVTKYSMMRRSSKIGQVSRDISYAVCML